MSREILLGTATYLGQVGETITVRVPGGTVNAKVMRSLSSSQVTVVKSGNQYYCYPAKSSSVTKQTQASYSFLKHNPKRKPDKLTVDTVVLYRVKRTSEIAFSCTCPTWANLEPYGCVDVCDGTGAFESLSACRADNPPVPPEQRIDDEFSIAYFNPGFLSVFGAPTYSLDFFYQLQGVNPNYPYCRNTLGIPTGFTQPIQGVITGNSNDKYTARNWLLPYSEDIYNGNVYFPGMLNNGRERFASHWWYTDPNKIGIQRLQQWNEIYGAAFFDFNRNEPSNIYSGEVTFRGPTNIPWEVSINAIDEQGNYIYDTSPTGPRQRVLWFGLPNWIWRGWSTEAIALYDTIYTIAATMDSFPIDFQFFKAFAEENYGFRTGRNISYRVAAPTSNIQLPPISLISRTYSASEGAPTPPASPPGGGAWQLLWNTRTCPIDPDNPTDNPWERIRYSVWDYYVKAEGEQPILLKSLREDDPVETFLSNYGDGEYYGSLVYGKHEIRACKILAFNNVQEPQEFSYPSEVILNQKDWQKFRAYTWERDQVGELAPEVCFAEFTQDPPFSGEENGIYFDSSTTNINEDESILIYINPSQEIRNNEILSDVIFVEDVRAKISIFEYQSDDAANTCQIDTIEQEYDIDIAQIQGAIGAEAELLNISVFIGGIKQ